jgi:hypothetical protein
MPKLKIINWLLNLEDANQLKGMFKTAIQTGQGILNQQIIKDAPASMIKLYKQGVEINKRFLKSLTNSFKSLDKKND